MWGSSDDLQLAGRYTEAAAVMAGSDAVEDAFLWGAGETSEGYAREAKELRALASGDDTGVSAAAWRRVMYMAESRKRLEELNERIRRDDRARSITIRQHWWAPWRRKELRAI